MELNKTKKYLCEFANFEIKMGMNDEKKNWNSKFV